MTSVSVRLFGSAIKKSQYGICTLQYDRVGVSRLTQNGSANTRTAGVPDTVRLPVQEGKPNTIVLHEQLQLWMHNLSWQRSPSMSEEAAKMAWRSLMMGASGENTRTARAFSNFTGSGTNHDYVNDTNRQAEPIRIDFILCGGAFVKLLDKDNRKKIKSEDCWVAEAIDPAGDFRQFHPRTHPHLFFYPTISVRVPLRDRKGNPTGRYYIEYVSQPFPQYNDLCVMPILAQAGENFVFIPENRITLADQPKSPFRRSTEKDAYNDYTTALYPNPYAGVEVA